MMNFAEKRMWSMLGMRGVFAMRMGELAATHPELIVLTADLGVLSGLARFKKEYPERLINAGIAEQNMIGMAAGLAHEGFVPFATTYATFLSMRSCEQIRHLCAYSKNPVKIIASGSGFAMGMSGNSHYTYEDLAIMRAIPELTVLSPADGAETYKMIDAALADPRPMYIRLGGGLNIPMVYKEDYHFEIGKAVLLREGADVAIFATGTMVAEAMKAAKILAESGVECTVLNNHTLKPLDRTAILCAVAEKRLVVTVEEHSTIGGLGGAVAEILAEVGGTPPLLRVGMPDVFIHPGEYQYLLTECKLNAPAIANKIKDVL